MLFGFGEKVEEAKKAVKEASQTKDDPAERVTPEGAATTNEGQQVQGGVDSNCMLGKAANLRLLNVKERKHCLPSVACSSLPGTA